MGELGLGPVIIREDMSQGALLGCSQQGATLPRVTDQEIELSRSMTSLLVSLFPSATRPWINLPTTEQASSLPSGNQTSVCLLKETIASHSWTSAKPVRTSLGRAPLMATRVIWWERMSEPLKIGFRFTHTLEGCRIAGLHIDTDDVHRVPQPAVSVLHTSFLNIL